MSISELENQLASAQERVKELMGPKATLEEKLAAFDVLALAQRALAAAKGDEHAVPYDIGFKPEAAVSEPVILQTDNSTILTFSAVQKKADGKYHEVGYGVVEFDLCMLTKFGYPNDEARPGHPLFTKGLGDYGVYEVRNSSWIKQKTEQNRVRFPNTPDSTAKHFIFTFHDSTFECIARALRASLSTEPYEKLFAEIAKRVFV